MIQSRNFILQRSDKVWKDIPEKYISSTYKLVDKVEV